MTKIDEKDAENLIMYAQSLLKLKIKNIKKTGKNLSQLNYFKMALQEIKKTKIKFTEKTKKYIISLFENKMKKPVTINKLSKVYLKASKDVQSNFGNIDKKDIKELKSFMQYSRKIIIFLKKYKLNDFEKDALLVDFFVSKGYTETEALLLMCKGVLLQLEILHNFLKSIQKYKEAKK